MNNWKTTLVGILKLLGAVSFIIFKVTQGSPLTEADIGLITLAASGGLGNLLSADAKPKDKEDAV